MTIVAPSARMRVKTLTDDGETPASVVIQPQLPAPERHPERVAPARRGTSGSRVTVCDPR